MIKLYQVLASSGNNMNNNNLKSDTHGSNSAIVVSIQVLTHGSDECGCGNEESHNVIDSPNIDYEVMLLSVVCFN